jgi:hypothetical protein
LQEFLQIWSLSHFTHSIDIRMLLPQYFPIKIGSEQFLAVSERDQHIVVDSHTSFWTTNKTSPLLTQGLVVNLQPRDGCVSGRRRGVSRRKGVHGRRPRRGATVTRVVACAHSRLEL